MLKKEYLIYKLSEAAREACKIDNVAFVTRMVVAC